MQKPYLNQYLSTTTSKIDRRLPAIYKVNNDVSLFLAVHWPAPHAGLVAVVKLQQIDVIRRAWCYDNHCARSTALNGCENSH